MDNSEQKNALAEQLKQKFGLNADPFDSATGVFFEGAQRQHNLETLRHMAIFGDMVLLLTGEKGAGKSSLLNEFAHRYGSEIHLQLLSASTSGISQSLISRLANMIGLELISNEPAAGCLQRIYQKLEVAFQRSGKRTLIVIDDADLMPKEELKLFFALFKDLPPESGVALLLLALPSLIDFAAVDDSLGREEWFHQIQLKPFFGTDLVDYLQLRMERVGYADKLVLSGQELGYLAEMGKGLPGRINRVFAGVVLGSSLFAKAPDAKQRNVSQKILFSISGVLLLSFLFVSYQHGLFDSMPPEKQLDVSNKEEFSEASVELTADGSEKLARDRRIEALDRALEKLSVRADLVGVIESPETIDELFVQPETDPKHIEKSSESLPKASEGSLIREVATATQEQEQEQELELELELDQESEQEISSELGAKEGNQVDPSFKDYEWVLRQPASDYSVQVLGSYNRGTALEFIAQAKRKGISLFYLETVYKGRPWYVVFYGQYSSKSEAQHEVSQASPFIRNQKPWIRSFKGIRQSYPK